MDSSPTEMETDPSTSPAPPRRHQHPRARPSPYLIITNISKRQNVKNLLQIAAAHGCATVFVVGQRGFEFDPDAEGTDVPPAIRGAMRSGAMEVARFDKLADCVERVKRIPYDGAATGKNSIEAEAAQRSTIPIVGVEIDPSSKNVEEEPFSSSVAFMMGNEGSGMSPKQMAACNGFVRISQYGGGTASLNVSVAAGIVLHRFFHWSRGDSTKQNCDN